MEEQNFEVIDAEEIETLTPQKKNKKINKKHNIIKRIISLILAGTVTISSAALYIFRNNIKIKTSELKEIEELIIDDNTATTSNQRNITVETTLNLEKIETYLNLSNTLNNLYEKYKDKITNLNLGEATITKNTVNEMTKKEYTDLCNDLKIIATKKKEDDEYYQAVGRAVSYSSHINAYLAYNAPKAIYDSLLDNCANDVANALEIDFKRITIDYNKDTKKLMIIRNDNNTGEATYNIETKGIRIQKIEEILLKSYTNYTKVENFLSSKNQSIYDEKGNCLMTLGENQGLIVYINEDLNKDIRNYMNLLKIVLCSTYEIKNAEFKYDYAIQPKNSEQQTQEANLSANTKGLKLKR